MINPQLLPSNAASIFDRVKGFTAPISKSIRERIQSLMAGITAQPKPAPKPFNKAIFSYKSLTSDLRPLGDKMVLSRVLLARLFTFPEVEHLISTAFNGKPFTIIFANSSDLHSEGECNFAKCEITLQKNLPLANMLSTLIFELCNASNHVLEKTLVNQFNNEHDYALAMERAEFITYQLHIRHLSSFINNKDFICMLEGIGEDIDKIKCEVKEAYQIFDEYWHDANMPNNNGGESHSEYYRNHYRRLMNKIPASFTPGFHASKNPVPDPLKMQFVSPDAKEFFSAICQNSKALAILNRCPLSLVAGLAKNITRANLQGFRALNPTEQVVFITKYLRVKLEQLKSTSPSLHSLPLVKVTV